MANTLTGLIPTINAALDVVSRELIGFIPNVMRDATAESGAVGQTVRSPVVPAGTLEDITPGATPADSGDQTIGYVDLSITKSKAYPIRWTGEEQKSITKDGIINVVLAGQFAQGFRALANAVEVDLAAQFINASRAYGTAGTTPFATAADMSDLSNANRILDENGAPATGRKMIVGGAARANLEGKHSELFKVNESGDAGALLRQRQMRTLMGFTMGWSAGIASQAATAVVASPAYLTTVSGSLVVGTTTIPLNTGDGAHVQGEIISFAGDPNKYVIATGGAAGAHNVVLAAPGLRQQLETSVAATTVGGYTANMFFSENALLLAARTPAMPEGGDDADDVTTVQDPVSGLVFQIALYRQYRRIKYEIGLAWGTKMVKTEHAGILLG